MTTMVLPAVDQLLQHFQQLLHVVEVQAGGGFVEDVEGAAGGAFGEFLGELDALRLAAGERGGLLADLDVAEADALERDQLVADHRDRFEEGDAVLDGHVQNLGDRLGLILDLERFAVVAGALAGFAGRRRRRAGSAFRS